MKILEIFKIHKKKSLFFNKPYFIAEIGVNHEGKLSLAKKLIDDASEAGADAVKFQTYKANKLALKNSPSYWNTTKESTTNQYDLFKKYDNFSKQDYVDLKKHCIKKKIEFISTPFDKKSANFLNDLLDVFKISSSDLNNKPFIEYICEFKKPIILSTGASNISEIEEAINWIEKKNVPVAILHCILNYPTPYNYANLGMIRDLINNFPNKVVGYSDHTLSNANYILETAYILGAKIIEKHFTYNKKLEGNDHYHSFDKEDLINYNKRINYIRKILGNARKHSIPSERNSRINARRSLVASCFIPARTKIKINQITYKRPGFGMSPKEIDNLIGKKTKKNIKKDEILRWEMFN